MLKYAFAKRQYCPMIQDQGPSCKCFELSAVTKNYEVDITYQDHKVCTECKYNSHCRLFNPLSYCLDEVPRARNGTLFKIGNPT